MTLQTVGEPPPGLMHLDVHAEDAADVEAISDRARGLGAEHVADGDDGCVVHRSPGGITFCVVPRGEARRPAPVSWPAGHSLVVQVCVDGPGPVSRRARGPPRLHVDLAAEDVAAEVGRHLDLGAQGVRTERHWTTLMDPAGRLYCVTGRDPGTGRLP